MINTPMSDDIIMIHEMYEGMDVPKGDVLTFDDGLFSQYQYANDLPNKKIFFISSGIICEGEQSSDFITCRDAHEKARAGNFENYMTVEQILDLNGEIGGHSHFHKNLNEGTSWVNRVDYIKMDTELMLEWFEKNLHFTPTSFCFPYNDDFRGIYKAILHKYGFTDFYGAERINIDDLLPPQEQKKVANLSW